MKNKITLAVAGLASVVATVSPAQASNQPMPTLAQINEASAPSMELAFLKEPGKGKKAYYDASAEIKTIQEAPTSAKVLAIHALI